MSRTPEEIMADFDMAATGLADIDIYDILWEIIEDILDSVKLAEDELNKAGLASKDIYNIVKDYVTNNYGD